MAVAEVLIDVSCRAGKEIVTVANDDELSSGRPPGTAESGPLRRHCQGLRTDSNGLVRNNLSRD